METSESQPPRTKGPIKLRRVNKDEPPKKAAPAPAASSVGGGGDLMSELTARISRRRQAMAGEQIAERRQLLNLPPVQPAQPAQDANIVQTPIGAFNIPEGDTSSEEESSSSSDWDD